MMTANDPVIPGEKGRWSFWLAAASAFAAGVAIRMQTFALLWTGVHNSWGGAFYGNAARNFVRYGYGPTKLAPVINSGVVEPAQFVYYLHHPPLVTWLTSVSFHMFGVQEWSARLFPLLFSVLTMALVFHIARACYGRATALCALAFFAVLPADAYYAAHVDPYGSMAIFFTTLAVEGYRRWLGSRRDRDFALCATAIVLGCMTSWFTFFIIPGIFGHYWLIHRTERKSWLRIWMLPAIAVAMFGLFLLHRTIALSGGGMEVFDALGTRVAKRTAGDLGRLAISRIYVRHLDLLYGVPLAVLGVTWSFFFLRDWKNKRLRTADWCIAILLSYGVLYAITFPGHITNHDFFVRALGPGVALACAVALTRVVAGIRPPTARFAATVAVAGIVCGFATVRTQELFGRDNLTNGPVLSGFGKAVADLSTPRDPVFLPIDPDAVLQYYVDRPSTYNLDTPRKMDAAVAAATGPYLILVPERSARHYPGLLAHLRENYTEVSRPGLYMFDGKKRDTPR